MTANEVLSIINKHDPVGLLSVGCDGDEYEKEAQLISDLLNATTEDIVSLVFSEMFSGVAIPKENLQAIAFDLDVLKKKV